jgi:hypothetical protein
VAGAAARHATKPRYNEPASEHRYNEPRQRAPVRRAPPASTCVRYKAFALECAASEQVPMTRWWAWSAPNGTLVLKGRAAPGRPGPPGSSASHRAPQEPLRKHRTSTIPRSGAHHHHTPATAAITTPAHRTSTTDQAGQPRQQPEQPLKFLTLGLKIIRWSLCVAAWPKASRIRKTSSRARPSMNSRGFTSAVVAGQPRLVLGLQDTRDNLGCGFRSPRQAPAAGERPGRRAVLRAVDRC